MTEIPHLPAHATKTYAASSAMRPATCLEASCGAYLHGWTTLVDEGTTLGQAQAHYVRKDSGRAFTEVRTEAGLTLFTFEAGQACFASNRHRIAAGRELYIVREGNLRENPRGGSPRIHVRPADWVEDMAEHQDRIITRLAQG